MKTNRIPFIILIFAILGLFFGFFLGMRLPLSTQSQAGFQAYTDSVNGFSLKFPLAATQQPLTGEKSTDPEKGQTSLPSSTSVRGRWLEISALDANDKNLSFNKCFILNDFQATVDRFLNGRRYCQTSTDEGAAGSIYRTDIYVTKVGAKYVALKFTSLYATDVHVYPGCEEDVDISSPSCQALQFDPVRDLQLFDQIAATLTAK